MTETEFLAVRMKKIMKKKKVTQTVQQSTLQTYMKVWNSKHPRTYPAGPWQPWYWMSIPPILIYTSGIFTIWPLYSMVWACRHGTEQRTQNWKLGSVFGDKIADQMMHRKLSVSIREKEERKSDVVQQAVNQHSRDFYPTGPRRSSSACDFRPAIAESLMVSVFKTWYDVVCTSKNFIS